MKKITITIKDRPLRKGHQERNSSAGAMGDRRTKRNRTRGAKSRKAIQEG